MMWYLSRTPHTDSNAQPNDLFNSTFRNSIFPVSETGLFEEISIVEVPNKPRNINGGDNKDDDAHHTHCTSNTWTWQWFAHPASLTKFRAVAVPWNASSSVTLQLLAVLPERLLCARLASSSHPLAVLCTYLRINNSWHDVPRMEGEERNPIVAAGAILNGWLYLAGGYEGNPSYVEPSNYLNSAERLNLKTLEWQPLPPMHKPRAFSTGLAHKGKFYVVGGQPLDHSAEVYNPTSNSWQFLKSFVPKEADGFAMTSMHGLLMLLLTWSDRLGIKLWVFIESVNLLDTGWRFLCFFPNSEVERVRFRQHGARMVWVGKEVWVLMGECDQICQVDGSCGWPVFPAPVFGPSDGCELVRKGNISAFSFQVRDRVSWRHIPVYKI